MQINYIYLTNINITNLVYQRPENSVFRRDNNMNEIVLWIGQVAGSCGSHMFVICFFFFFCEHRQHIYNYVCCKICIYISKYKIMFVSVLVDEIRQKLLKLYHISWRVFTWMNRSAKSCQQNKRKRCCITYWLKWSWLLSILKIILNFFV